jgi:hypothetical protein
MAPRRSCIIVKARFARLWSTHRQRWGYFAQEFQYRAVCLFSSKAMRNSKNLYILASLVVPFQPVYKVLLHPSRKQMAQIARLI